MLIIDWVTIFSFHMWVNNINKQAINLHKWHFSWCNSFYNSKLSRTVGITAIWTLFTSTTFIEFVVPTCTCMIVSCWLLTPGSIWTSLFCHLYSRIPDLVLQMNKAEAEAWEPGTRRWTVKGKPVLLAAHAELKCRAVQPMKWELLHELWKIISAVWFLQATSHSIELCGCRYMTSEMHCIIQNVQKQG